MYFNKKDGFTLVELIVVIAILAILAGVGVPTYTGYIEKANETADQLALSNLNTAFASACAGNGVVARSANLDTTVTDGGMKVNGIANINDAAPSDEVKNDFAAFYAVGEDAAFKVYTRLYFDAAAGCFSGKYPMSSQQAAVDRWNKGNMAGKTDELSGSVQNVTNMLGDRLDLGGLDLLKNSMGADYEGFMEKYGLTEDSDSNELANATVMYVADKLGGLSATDVQGMMVNGGIDNVVKELGEIPTAALMYGMMTGYANSGYAPEDFKLGEPTGIDQVLGQAGSMLQDENFQDYYNNADSSLIGGMTDLDSFLAAMEVVNGYEGSFDLSQENLFTSDESQALLESILGTAS